MGWCGRFHQIALGVLALTALGCTRAGVASIVPALDLGISAQRRVAGNTVRELVDADRAFHAVLYVALSFRAVTAASQIPLRAELRPEVWIAPCDDDDVICLQEAAAMEAELAQALGELQ